MQSGYQQPGPRMFIAREAWRPAPALFRPNGYFKPRQAGNGLIGGYFIYT